MFYKEGAFNMQKRVWDSSFFKQSIYEFSGSYEELRKYDKAALEPDSIIYFFSDRLAPELEKFLVDKKITYSIEPHCLKLKPNSINVEIYHPVRPINEKLYDLAIQSSLYSRFRRLGLFRDEDVDSMYRRWIEKAFEHSNEFYISSISEQDEIISLILSRIEGCTANIDIVATDIKVRGKGLGRKVLHQTLYYLFSLDIKKIFVTTQLDNVAACSLYESSGFKKYKLKYIYHIRKEELSI